VTTEDWSLMDCQEYFVDLEMSLAGVATALEVSVPGQLFSSLRMVYFTTFVHNSPRLPLYKYQGETGSIQFVTMIVMSLYECGNTRESLQDRHLR
jgi:hypothetical protein